MSAYLFITRQDINLRIIFNANFLAGAVILCTALTVMIIPFRLFTPDKLADHSTFAERFLEQRELKRRKAYELLFIGITVIVNTGIVQLALA
ncbi:MAG: hypothetical protein FWG89_05345 [Treponema sp.]|nr:hypothetical protein [Treponema sp.]